MPRTVKKTARRPSFGRIVLAILVAVVLGGLVLEGGFRLLVPMDALVYQDSANPSLRFELRPNSRGIKNNVMVEINEQGIRDRKISDQKDPSEFRILMVGDHPTFGVGVPVEETFTRHVQGFVQFPKHLRPSTINLSMYHYNLSQKVELLRTRAPLFQPDYIVLQISGSDEKSIPPSKYPWVKLKNLLRSKSRFARWVIEKSYWKRKVPVQQMDSGPSTPAGTGPVKDGFLAHLESVRDYARQQNLPLTVVFVPNLSLTNSGDVQRDAALAEKTEKFCAESRIDFLNAANSFRFFAPESLLLHRDQPWLNSKGHRALAEDLSRNITKQVKRLPLLKERRSR